MKNSPIFPLKICDITGHNWGPWNWTSCSCKTCGHKKYHPLFRKEVSFL